MFYIEIIENEAFAPYLKLKKTDIMYSKVGECFKVRLHIAMCKTPQLNMKLTVSNAKSDGLFNYKCVLKGLEMINQ